MATKNSKDKMCIRDSQIGEKYMSGSTIRQDYLETVLKWISAKENKTIEDYMSEHQHDEDANELWMYYQDVIDWIKRLFPRLIIRNFL